jgi:DNA-binding CsgD family transcriptional regulator
MALGGPASRAYAKAGRVARLAAQGRSEAEIAHTMVLTLDTVRSLLRNAHDALATTTTAELGTVLSI